ncbi:dihydrodipicolinate synthase family protein [Conexibacter sp. CPCC 206217]|uniref:dihydrodipicolinate synthase family protein n=1 Tax=Conexibacter sp. CPCC 206217 TaxID=3064574 RepID=UPI0027252312|nr:dihydrodipicolinate synthase family protein [Conexibacter sp. CPCC 206217]MDO8211976.1 dihydrodipicolinate synthase family protein [Conexibacter sp. CPCC 206217]
MAETVGVMPPCVTIFDEDGAVDEARTKEHVDWLLDAGVHALLALGTCGEFFSFETEERERLAARFVEWVDGRVPLYIGVMDTSTDIAVRLARSAEAAGATGVMSVAPYYSSPPRREVMQYFRDIAAAVEIPFVVYNNPGASGVSLETADLAELANDGTAKIVKESHGDPARIHDLKLTVPADVPVLYGEDYGAFEAICGGADGWVAGVSNFMPHEAVKLWNLAQAGELEAAREQWYRILPLVNMTSIKPMFGRADERPDFIQIFKAGLERVGRTGGPCRRPLLPLPPEDVHYLHRLMDEIGLTPVAA